MLPTSVPPTPILHSQFVSTPQHASNGHGLTGRRSNLRIPLIFRRILKFQQMDFEVAAWQMTYLCISPRRVYRNVYYHKQTKNQWARDDPAMLLLISACLCVAAIAWAVVYSLSIVETLRLAFFMVFRDFIGVGILVATCLWLLAPLMMSPSQTPSHYSPSETRLEWAYAFDVHTNSFFPLYLSLYLLQLFLVPVITKDRWVCLWVGNTLYLAAFTQYIYITYLGISALPFLIRSQLVLFPILPLLAAYIASLLGFNLAKWVLSVYFG